MHLAAAATTPARTWASERQHEKLCDLNSLCANQSRAKALELQYKINFTQICKSVTNRLRLLCKAAELWLHLLLRWKPAKLLLLLREATELLIRHKTFSTQNMIVHKPALLRADRIRSPDLAVVAADGHKSIGQEK